MADNPQFKSSALHLEMNHGIAHLGLGAPPRNELTEQRLGELCSLIKQLTSNTEIRGLILMGRGRHFSSGADVGELTSSPSLENTASLTRNRQGFERLEKAPFPVVAAIRGCCFGVGLELALACHFRVATSSAVLAMPEVEYGLIPGCGGTVRLAEKIGMGPAIELIMSGRTCAAEEAYQLGLVDRVVDKKELHTAATLAIHNAIRAGHPQRTPQK